MDNILTNIFVPFIFLVMIRSVSVRLFVTTQYDPQYSGYLTFQILFALVNVVTCFSKVFI